ncbi:hypothetical protein IFR05_002678 [Cadophora sp. M221]|nr:hypothetical protein IFR05_002678 [Cadophora sp. M221]
MQRLNNLEFETHENIPINDLRDLTKNADINDCGFQVVSHLSSFCGFESTEHIQDYRVETEQLLKGTLGAVYVKCYDSVLRKNVTFERDTIDLGDPLHIEGPARGAITQWLVHAFSKSQNEQLTFVDITYVSGPSVTNRYMSNQAKEEFLKPGYRIRIVNTWRTLVPVLEDRPLALCDSRSVDPKDLIAADRVIPSLTGEVYSLTYNANHNWFWLEKQTLAEPFIFVMYDTKCGPHARFYPHVSFRNPNAPEGAALRESIETRSVVITKEWKAGLGVHYGE